MITQQQQTKLIQAAKAQNPNITLQEAKELLSRADSLSQKQPSNWLTGNAQDLGGKVLNAAGNILNLPSYALGGVMKGRTQSIQQGNINPGLFSDIRSAVQGVKEKTPVMQELPKMYGVDPESLGGQALGFGGELLTPGLPLGLFSKGAKGVKMSQKVINSLGDDLVDLSKQVMVSGVGNPTLIAKIEKKAGMPIQELMSRYPELIDRSADTAKELKGSLIKKFNEIGMGSKGSVHASEVIDSIDNQIIELQKRARIGDDVARKSLPDLMDKRNTIVQQIKSGDISETFSVPSLIERKRASAKGVPSSELGLGPSAMGSKASNEYLRDLYQKLSISQEPELRQLGRDILSMGGDKKNRGVIDLFESAEKRSQARQPINFTKLGSAGIGGILGGFPGAVTGYLGERVITSPKGLSFASRGLKQIGEKAKSSKGISIPEPIKKIFGTGTRVAIQPKKSKESQKNSELKVDRSSSSIIQPIEKKQKIVPRLPKLR